MIFNKKTIQTKECTMTTIKYGLEESENHFFDRQTLKFFGQRLSDFKKRVINGRVFIFATSRKNFDNKRIACICSIREVIAKRKDLLALKVCDSETEKMVIDHVQS